MLQMNRLEIETLIRTELEKNVVLEVAGDSPSEDEASRQNVDDFDADQKQKDEKDQDPFSKIDVEAFFADYMDSQPTTRKGSYEFNPDQTSFEQMLSSPVSLTDHLNWQLDLSIVESVEKDIGRAIIGNLNKSGYLMATIEEISSMDGGFTPERVERVLELVQSFDPAGIAARNLSECILLQMRNLDLDDPVLENIINNHLERIQNQDFSEITKDLKISKDELKDKLEILRNFDPKPGLKYNTERIIYIEPEVFVTREEGVYKVRINDDGLPRLRINPYYRKLANMKERGEKEAVDYIQEKMKAAMWLMKSFDQRQKTIYKVSESIIDRQRDFFDYGEDGLKPMVLSDIAQDIDMHESTVSRVVSNKYMHTPRGVFELKYFFQRGIASSSGDDISSLIVKKKIDKMIKSENQDKPLSDAKISQILLIEGLQIARRTVAKYREEMRIPSSSKRRKKL